MNIRIPWIINRRRKLFAISIDFILSIFIYNYIFLKEIGSLPNKLVCISLASFWIISSYVLGRYNWKIKIKKHSILEDFLKLVILFFLCNLTYLIINLSFPLIFNLTEIKINTYLSIGLFNLFIICLFYISISSFLIQNFCRRLTLNIHDKKKEWVFYGSKEKYTQLLKKLKQTKSNPFLSVIFDDQELDFAKLGGAKGLILESLDKVNKKNLNIIFNLQDKGMVIENTFTWFEKEFHRIPTELIENKNEFFERIRGIEDNYQLRTKRIGDLFISLLLLLITLPLFFIIGILIFIEDRGPLFYSQKRTGLNGRIFKITKFRSMKIDAEKGGVQWSQKFDPRVTKIGRIIRATRLDELPQLFCVISGSMSLIGPRPERPEIEDKLLQNIPFYKYRNIIKPGISGWAQVNYPYGASKLDTSIKLSYDIYYLFHYSLLLDLLILFKTIRLVLNAEGSNPIE